MDELELVYVVVPGEDGSVRVSVRVRVKVRVRVRVSVSVRANLGWRG